MSGRSPPLRAPYAGFMMHPPPRLAVHPFADLLPRMAPQEFDELVADIERYGQREAATVWTDSADVQWLLDGRHRADAAHLLGRELRVSHFEGSEEDARSLVLSLNIRRRHLSASARALAAGALARRTRGGVSGVREQAAGLPIPPTHQQAAEIAGISERLVRDGSLVVASGADEVIQAVARGELSVTAAASLIRRSQRDRQAAAALYLAHRRSSASDVWLTPQWVIERAVACLGGIDGDVAAEPERGVPARWWITAEDDALSAPSWANADGSPSRIWLNPPYGQGGRGPGEWTRRLVAEWHLGNVRSALVLLPARPGARWQQELAPFPRVEFSDHLEFAPGVGNPAVEGWAADKRNQAPFASILLGVGLAASELHEHFGDVGVVYTAYLPHRDPRHE
ncbi:DNA N-6-adenine-methyltransferase [Microbacterium sp. zg-YB36]|uniref:DNA N-6-adenine-methyltransferase n=1 Tax=Microbacterium sp. zg-YB36 TaxID=2969407 RepID=UPI003364D7C7